MNKLVLSKKVMLGLCIASCTVCGFAKPKAAKAVDPVAAVTKLAPVTQLAKNPTEGVYYSLFVRSFADGNGDGIGDFKGLTKRLDYLNDGNDLTTSDLGITGLWLLPIFASPSYHGYDVDDYYSVNPEYGTMKDFETFIAEAHKRGIKVILDMTCNHSSPYNDWFKASRNPNDPHRDWYRWITDLDLTEFGGKYNGKQKIWGHNVWTIDNTPVEGKKLPNGDNVYSYYAGVFGSQMPDYNMDSKGVREEFKKVFKFWLDKGVDGFRFDAVGHIYNSVEVMPGSETANKAVQFCKEMQDYITSVKPGAFCVAEVWEPTSTRAKYIAGFQSNFHFDMGNMIINAINGQEQNENDGVPVDPDPKTYNGIAHTLYGDYQLYKASNPNYIDSPFLSNHDQGRSAAPLRKKLPKMKLAADMYILAEGVPFIYYGEEIAMMSGSDDPTKRTPFVWKEAGKDKMQPTWCYGGPYGNIENYNKKTVPVSVQEKDPNSLLQHYKRVIRVKTAHPALFKGRLVPKDTGNPYLESWVMECAGEKAFVVHNVSAHNDVTVKLPEGCDMPMVYAANPNAKVEGGMLTIPAMSSVVLAQNK